MADVAQIYSILNSVAAQAFGTSAQAVVDTRSMIALGDQVLSSSNNTDLFSGALMDRIGRTIVSSRIWNDPMRDPLVKKPFEFGSVLQKIYVDIEDAAPNNAWEIGDQNYTPTFAPVYKPDVRQKLFNKISPWQYNQSIPDRLYRTGFTSEEAMAAFITALGVAIENSMAEALRNANNLCRNTLMAYVINGAGKNAVNVLTLYNTDHPGATLTAAQAAVSPDFQRYLVKTMNDYKVYLRDLTRAFNMESFARHTPEEDLVITVLETVDSSIKAYLQSDTYHKELVSLGNRYNTVPYWQGPGTAGYTFSSLSGFKIKIVDPSDSTKSIDVQQSGVLAVMHDIEAIGTTINDRRTTTERNNMDEYTDIFTKANIGYFADRSENCVVFYIADAS